MLLIEDRLEAAKSHLAAGRSDSAALLYESVLDLSPANVVALSELALIKLRAGDVKRAHALAGEAAARAANDPDVLSVLAKTALVSDREDEATAALDQALAVDPFHPEACQLKANLLVQQSNPRDAEQLIHDALEKHPTDPDLLGTLSEIYRLHGITAPALELSQKALARDPERPQLLARFGTQLGEVGDHGKAAGFFERAHVLEPGNALYMVQLADTQAALGELNAAYQTAKRATKLFPELLPAWASYVRVMTYRGEAQAGLAEFLPVAKRHPDKIVALLTLAAAYRIAGEPSQALRLVGPVMRKLQTLKPEQRSRVMALVRDCLLSVGMFDHVSATFSGFDARAALGLPPEPSSDSHVKSAAALGDGPVTESDGKQPAADVDDKPPVADPNGEPPAETAIDAPPAVDPELALALDETGFVIDGSLSTLETIVLLRFRCGARETRSLADVSGPAHIAPVVELMENVRFAPTDIPARDHPGQPRRMLPLSHILALPAATRGEITGALPYFRASEERRAIWRRSLAELPRPLVALAWDANRPGLLLEDYRAVLSKFEGTLVSVIWDDSRHQLATWREIIDAGVHFGSLVDLAAVIAETDAIIGPDGIPLHVAGAMGRPGALLSVPSTPWYWHADGEKASWYPTISVFKTRAFGNWQEKLPELGEQIWAFLGGLETSGRPAQTEQLLSLKSQQPVETY